MGEYFNWVNFDKQEWLDGGMWHNAPSLRGRCYTGIEENEALLTLLATRWKGDVVVFLGDYANFTDDDNECCRHLQGLLEQRGYGYAACDFMYDGKTANGYLAVTKDFPEDRRNDPDNEELDYYPGPCDLKIEHFRYVVNGAKREYIDYQKTPIFWVCEELIQRYDPFPEMMASAIGAWDDPGEIEGRWLGDIVCPTNDDPGEGYRLIAEDYVHQSFKEPYVYGLTDEEFCQAMNEAGLSLTNLESDEIITRIALWQTSNNPNDAEGGLTHASKS